MDNDKHKDKITINKKKIAENLKSKLGLSNSLCEELVSLFFEGIYKITLIEKQLTLQNFGGFSLIHKKSRPAQNMSLGIQIMLPARKILRFSPSKLLKNVIKHENIK